MDRKMSVKPDGKGVSAEATEERKGPGFVYLIKKNKVYIICWLIAAASITAIVLVAIRYWDLKEHQINVDYEFQQLRGSLAVAVNDPELLAGHPQDVAEEIRQLPQRLAKAIKVKNDKKNIYEGIFHRKSIRASSWHRRDKSRYYFSKGEKTWYDAEDFCSAQGAHLASVLDNKEQNFITSKLQRTSWIGLTTENEEGKWRWSDGSKLVQEYWSEDQPSNLQKSNQDCAMIVPSLASRNWKNNSCLKRYRWVCKENLDLGEG